MEHFERVREGKWQKRDGIKCYKYWKITSEDEPARPTFKSTLTYVTQIWLKDVKQLDTKQLFAHLIRISHVACHCLKMRSYFILPKTKEHILHVYSTEVAMWMCVLHPKPLNEAMNNIVLKFKTQLYTTAQYKIININFPYCVFLTRTSINMAVYFSGWIYSIFEPKTCMR